MWQKAISAVNGGGDSTLYRHKVNSASYSTGAPLTIQNVVGNVKALLVEYTAGSLKATSIGFIDDADLLNYQNNTWTVYSGVGLLTQTGTTITMHIGSGGAVTATCYYWSDEP